MAVASSPPTPAVNHPQKATSFSPPAATGTASTTPAPKPSSSSGDGAARARWKPQATKFPQRATDRSADFQNANCLSKCLGRPANQKRNAAATSLASRNARRGKEAARLEACLWRPRGSRKIAHQRPAGRISDGRRGGRFWFHVLLPRLEKTRP